MELEWGSVKTQGRGEGTSFFKLEHGENRLRVVSKPFKVNIHWEKSLIDGGSKRIICPGAGCPICKANHVPQSRFQVLAINRKSNKVELLEGGPSIFGAIRDLAVDDDYGDPSQYDIKIKKEGTGRETKYTVTPTPQKRPLTAEEQTLVEAGRGLADISKPKTVEEILAMGLECLAESNPDLDDDGDDWGSSSSSNSKGSMGDIDDEWNSI